MTLTLICVVLCSIMSQFVLTGSASTIHQYSETGFNKRKADAPKECNYCKLTLIFKKKEN